MEYIILALVGLVVGAIAKFLVPGKQGGGIIVTALLGAAILWVLGLWEPYVKLYLNHMVHYRIYMSGSSPWRRALEPQRLVADMNNFIID